MIRPAEPRDELFILSGWSASYRMSRDIGFIQMENYADVMHPIVRSVLARPRAKTLVSEGHIQRAFLCFEDSEIGNPPLVHYVYTAQPYRRQGFARDLFEAAGIDPRGRFEYASRTQASWELMNIHRVAPLAAYNPLRARFAEERKSR